MKPGSCARLFQAEAMRDGRLHGAELASFGRHLTSCAICLREVQALEALAERLRAPAPEDGGPDELHGQRERTRLLAAFDRGLIAPRGGGGARRRLLWPGALVVAAAVGGLLFWRAPAPAPVPGGVVVRADSTAAWSKRTEAGREEITLRQGLLWIRVDHRPGQRRLVVLLPDGELEDLGTTFTVSAEGGRTTRVAVEEGRVVLRLRGQPPVALGPGDRWIPPALPAPAVAPPSPPPPRSSPPPAPARPDPSADLRAAMSALDAGRHREAAAAFTRFLRRHPADRRAEDAAYLRVIALQRLGAREDTRRAAQEYLRRHPTGFRRAEVERLSRIPEQPGR